MTCLSIKFVDTVNLNGTYKYPNMLKFSAEMKLF